MTKCDDGEIKQSLADRLRALQINQENWKNRINKSNEVVEINSCFKKRFSLGDDIFKRNEQVPIEKSHLNSKFGPKVQTAKLADRMLSLEKSAKQWRSRVADKDNQKFTISGKMASIDYIATKPVNNSTSLINNNKLINAKIDTKSFKKNDQIKKNDSAIKNDLTKKDNLSTRSIFAKNQETSRINNKNESIFKRDLQTAKPNVAASKQNHPLTVKTQLKSTQERPTDLSDTIKSNEIETLKLDDSFDKFFKPIKLEKVLSPSEDKEDFLDDIDQMNSSLLVIKKNVKVKNRKASTGNPLKKIQTTNQSQQDSQSNEQVNQKKLAQSTRSSIYSTNQTSNYLKTTITSKVSSTIRTDLDSTAKAGLQSEEDYQSVANKLKKSSDTQDHLDSNNLLPNKKVNKSLLQVKGRKKVQVRLVEPCIESVNEGDSYILITNNLIIAFIGTFTNIIERKKVVEVANKIFRRRELGFSGGKLVVIDNDKKTNSNDIDTFKSLLDNSTGYFNSAGNEEEDEQYENQIIKTNKVYILDQERQAFKLYEPMCSKQLYQHQLNPYDAYVLDFTTEVYVWLGFHLTSKTSVAIEQAQILFEQVERPDYSIFYKCNQNMEPITFQEKFFDWTHNYKHKLRKNSNDDDQDKRMNLKTFNVDEMLKDPDTVDFILDNTNIGRGDYYKDDNELLYIEVVTDHVKCWHINEYEKKEIHDQDLGQFFDTETYVVRWQYRINRLGNLEGKKFTNLTISKSKRSNHDEPTENIFKKAQRINLRKHKETLDNNVTGRERYCYFYWAGSNCSIANKGAAALMAIELDKEKGVQIQVKQSEEVPLPSSVQRCLR